MSSLQKKRQTLGALQHKIKKNLDSIDNDKEPSFEKKLKAILESKEAMYQFIEIFFKMENEKKEFQVVTMNEDVRNKQKIIDKFDLRHDNFLSPLDLQNPSKIPLVEVQNYYPMSTHQSNEAKNEEIFNTLFDTSRTQVKKQDASLISHKLSKSPQLGARNKGLKGLVQNEKIPSASTKAANTPLSNKTNMINNTSPFRKKIGAPPNLAVTDHRTRENRESLFQGFYDLSNSKKESEISITSPLVNTKKKNENLKIESGSMRMTIPRSKSAVSILENSKKNVEELQQKELKLAFKNQKAVNRLLPGRSSTPKPLNKNGIKLNKFNVSSDKAEFKVKSFTIEEIFELEKQSKCSKNNKGDHSPMAKVGIQGAKGSQKKSYLKRAEHGKPAKKVDSSKVNSLSSSSSSFSRSSITSSSISSLNLELTSSEDRRTSILIAEADKGKCLLNNETNEAHVEGFPYGEYSIDEIPEKMKELLAKLKQNQKESDTSTRPAKKANFEQEENFKNYPILTETPERKYRDSNLTVSPIERDSSSNNKNNALGNRLGESLIQQQDSLLLEVEEFITQNAEYLESNKRGRENRDNLRSSANSSIRLQSSETDEVYTNDNKLMSLEENNRLLQQEYAKIRELLSDQIQEVSFDKSSNTVHSSHRDSHNSKQIGSNSSENEFQASSDNYEYLSKDSKEISQRHGQLEELKLQYIEQMQDYKNCINKQNLVPSEEIDDFLEVEKSCRAYESKATTASFEDPEPQYKRQLLYEEFQGLKLKQQAKSNAGKKKFDSHNQNYFSFQQGHHLVAHDSSDSDRRAVGSQGSTGTHASSSKESVSSVKRTINDIIGVNKISLLIFLLAGQEAQFFLVNKHFSKIALIYAISSVQAEFDKLSYLKGMERCGKISNKNEGSLDIEGCIRKIKDEINQKCFKGSAGDVMDIIFEKQLLKDLANNVIAERLISLFFILTKQYGSLKINVESKKITCEKLGVFETGKLGDVLEFFKKEMQMNEKNMSIVRNLFSTDVLEELRRKVSNSRKKSPAVFFLHKLMIKVLIHYGMLQTGSTQENFTSESSNQSLSLELKEIELRRGRLAGKLERYKRWIPIFS